MLATGAISLIVGIVGWALLRAHEHQHVVDPAAA
jgi:hypothetical protein